MESCRYLVGIFIEFASGVQNRQHHFGGGDFFIPVNIHGNAAAVVGNGDAPVDMKNHFDLRAVPGDGFVDAVVDQFVNQVMQAVLPGAADVHGGTFPDRFEAFQNLDF